MKHSKLLFLLFLALLLGGGYGLAGATVNRPDKSDAQVDVRDPSQRSGGDSGFLSGPNDGEPLEIALEYLDKNKNTLGLTSDDLADVVVTDQYTSKHNGVTHIYLRQRHRGIEVFNANLNINIAADGSVINLGHSFVSELAKAINTTTPSLSATEAVESAAQELKLNISEPLSLLEEIGGPAEEVLLSDGGISLNDIPVKLMYQSANLGGSQEVYLAWNLAIYEKNAQHWWDMRIDALTGKTLDQKDLVINENWDDSSPHQHDTDVASMADPVEGHASSDVSASSLPPEDYRVYPMPAESPGHVSPAPPADGRTLMTNPADATASPYGWHDTDGVAGAEYTITRGNNVHAYEDGNNPGFSPDGGANLLFDFPIDLNQSPDDYEAAAIANLFYWNNIIHDVWYQYGFDEASGNFQENNYGNGGLGSDSVNAEAQDGSGSCNANMLTPPDGSNARMQMYTCNGRDGDLDNGVIVHEYWHGVSIRLTGGPSTSSCLNNDEQGGEGWSDWGGLMMTIEAGDAGTDSRGIGTWLFGQPPTGSGIRPAPYSTDMAINNYTYGDIGSQAVPHGVGFVWATMLWEMNWALIDQHGFDPDFYHGNGGNNIAMQLVIDGLKLQPCSPGFVDARDAILQADQTNNGGANQCLIWEAFAKRGLGYSADQGGSSSTTDGTEAFDMPPSCEGLVVTPPSQDICVGDTASYTLSVGQAFSPPVTMSATGQPAGTNATFTPNPVSTAPSTTTLTIDNTDGAAVGNHTITIMGTDGTNTSQTTANLNLFNANPGSLTLSLPADEATGVSPLPTFEWTAATQAATYILEVDDDSAFGSLDYTATVDGTTHTATSAFSPLTTYYWRVRAMNPCGNSSDSALFSFTTQDIPPILVVDDDDNNADVRAYYTDVLDALGQTYDVWDTNNSDNEPSGAELAPYDVVIWFTGDEFGGSAGPGSASEAALGSWLDSGKCLFMSSQEYHYDRGLTSFMNDYLGVSSVSNDSGNYSSVTGQGSLFGGLGSYSLSYPLNDYSDIVSPDGTAELAFSGNNENGAAVNKDSGVYRTTFWGYPFEAIPNLADRQEVLGRFLSWCNSGGGEAPDINVNPTSISVTVAEGDSTTETLTIGNMGTANLTWTIEESPSGLQGWSPTALSGGDRSQAADEVSGRAPLESLNQTAPESHQPYLPQAVLYDNGPLVNSPGTGSGGADESIVQDSSLGMGLFGFGHQTSAGNRIADDFTVDYPGGWTIDRITFYAYQTGSSTASTITDVNLQIWNGPPNDAGSQVVFGDTTTNRLINSTWSSIYRVTETTTGDTSRPIMANTVSVALYLPPGTYWLDWQTDGSLTSGPWVPPITINGQSTTGNALQFIDSWDSALDSETSTQQGLPFIIEGDVAGCTVGDIPWATVSPANGTTPDGSSTPVQVTFDSTGLATDTYTGTLCINSNDPDESLVEVPVQLTVVSPESPDIEVNPTSISVTVSEGDSSTETLAIGNVGSGTLNWNISMTSNWLTANPTSGTEAASASTDVTVGIDATNLTAGTYNDTLSITSNDPDEETVEVPVELTVVEPNQPAVIYGVRTTNVRDVSFTVSWLTDVAASGEVHYGTDPNNLNRTVQDVRGASTSDDTHYVLLENLSPETTYYFDVVSGSTTDDNEGSHYSLTTGPTVNVPGSDTIFGQVRKSDGTTPAIGSIVYITLSDGNGSGTSGQAAPLSALVGNDGFWATNLGNARTEDLSASFSYSASGDQLFLEAQGAADGKGCQSVDTSADTPAATIELGNSPCAISWDIDLQLGWNKMALPLQLTNPMTMTASEVCDEITSQGGDIAEINRWNAGGWEGHICDLTFNNFTLEMNTGYFIKSNSVSSWTIEGLPASSTTFDLQIGWNSISVPHTDGYTAETLCDEIISQGVTAVEIDSWQAGGWSGHICGLTFNNFNIERGKGYFVKTTSAGTVTPLAVASRKSQPQEVEEVPSNVGQAMPVRNFVVSNLRDRSVTLSWTTEEATTGYVRVADQVVYDIRGANTSSTTHYVTLENLSPETTYDIKIISGAETAENTGQVEKVTTAPTLDSIPQPDTIFGLSYQADGITPATGALVYVTVQDANGVGSEGKAKVLSALVDEDGYWQANLDNARTADISAPFNYSAQGDQLLIEVQGLDGNSATLTVDTADDAQAPDITLSTPTAVSVATYGTARARTPWQGGLLLITWLLAAAGWWYRKK